MACGVNKHRQPLSSTMKTTESEISWRPRPDQCFKAWRYQKPFSVIQRCSCDLCWYSNKKQKVNTL